MLKTVSSVTNAIGALNYKGTWDAQNNTPTLVSSVGTKGDYYVVSVAGNTDLNGITLWGVGDWAVFNGSIWQKVEGGDTGNFTAITVTGLTGYMYANNSSPVTASTSIPIASVSGAVANTINVLAGTGLSGGGSLASNVTLNIANTTVISGNYGSATQVGTFTVNGQGQITSASNVAIAIANTAITNGNITLGNTTVGLGNTATTVGNLTLTNVTIPSGTMNVSIINSTANVTANATFLTSSLPLVPEGYVVITLNGVAKKIPYYSV
jgi:hypothetical protein